MATDTAFHEPNGSPALRWGLIVLGAVALVAILWFLYVSVTGVSGVKVEAPPPQSVNMLPPPPPPPPPPPKPEEKPPEPTEKPTPAPQAPQPTPQAPAPLTQNAEAQAGTDSFGLAAGNGGGMGAPGSTGTCIGLNCGKGGGINDGVYRQYLSSALQQAVYRDNRSRDFASSAQFEILVTPDGSIDRVTVRDSSGRREDDEVLADIIRKVKLRAPPYSQRYPVVIRVRGRRGL